MTTNTNPGTGVRYGVISLDSLQDWVWDVFLSDGTNLTCKAIFDDWKESNPRHVASGADPPESLFEGIEECDYELETESMCLGLSYLGGAPLVWVYESPHRAYARECSPCVPNAGDLDSRLPLGVPGVECYSLPMEWFRGDGD